MKNWLSDSANLAMIGADAQSNPEANQEITTVVIPTATQLVSAIDAVDAGDNSTLAKQTVELREREFDEYCIDYMYNFLAASTKPAAIKLIAYNGMHLKPPSKNPPQPSTRATNSEIIAIGYDDFTRRRIKCKLMGNTETGSHHLEHGQDHREILWGFVPRHVTDYPEEIFKYSLKTNDRTNYITAPPNSSGLKMVAKARIVSKLREEGPDGPIVTLNMPNWDVEEEQARDDAELKTTHPDVHNPDGTLKEVPKDAKSKDGNKESKSAQ